MYSWLDASRVSFGIKGDFFSKKKKKVRRGSKKGAGIHLLPSHQNALSAVGRNWPQPDPRYHVKGKIKGFSCKKKTVVQAKLSLVSLWRVITETLTNPILPTLWGLQLTVRESASEVRKGIFHHAHSTPKWRHISSSCASARLESTV